MQDECEILERSSAVDGYGNPKPYHTVISTTDCGFQHIRPREVLGTGKLAMIDAQLRLPIATAIGSHDRVRATKRFGEILGNAEVYEIVGPAQRGPSGLVLSLRKAIDGNTD